MSKLSEVAIAIALSQDGQQEKPRGSNWGTPVRDYLERVGIDFPAAWCAAFAYWSFDESAKKLGIRNPVPKTASSLKMLRITEKDKVFRTPEVGDIGIQDHGHGTGHTVIVVKVNEAYIDTIEGNTNDTGSREGYEVCSRSRPINSFVGFLRF